MLHPSLFVPYVLFALIATAFAARKTKTRSRRPWITIGLLAFFFAFAHVDDVIGGLQHKWLCEREAGFWVYKPVKLPPELYDWNGTPKFITELGPNEEMLKHYVRFDWQITREYKRAFLKIDKVTDRIFSVPTGEVFAERITFLVWPSSFIPTIAHISATKCDDDVNETLLLRDWRQRVFPNQNDKKVR